MVGAIIYEILHNGWDRNAKYTHDKQIKAVFKGSFWIYQTLRFTKCEWEQWHFTKRFFGLYAFGMLHPFESKIEKALHISSAGKPEIQFTTSSGSV